jgi:hypothetical protein
MLVWEKREDSNRNEYRVAYSQNRNYMYRIAPGLYDNRIEYTAELCDINYGFNLVSRHASTLVSAEEWCERTETKIQEKQNVG